MALECRVREGEGSPRHTPGPIALVTLARERRLDTGNLPAIDARDATLLGGARVVSVAVLAALLAHLRGDVTFAAATEGEDLAAGEDTRPDDDLADVKSPISRFRRSTGGRSGRITRWSG